MRRLVCLCELHIDTAAAFVEVDAAVTTCVDGVILAHVYVVTWVPLGAALADDDVTGYDGFTAEFFDAKTLTA